MIHADDTTVSVLDPGLSKTKTGRLRVAVRDERTFVSTMPPAAVYRYSPDRTAKHAHVLLSGCRGHLHADGYAGFGRLYDPDAKAGASVPLIEVACWSQRKFTRGIDFNIAAWPPAGSSPSGRRRRRPAGLDGDSFVRREAD